MKKLILTSILLVFCAMVFPNIGHSLGFEGFGGKIGLVMPDGGDNTIGFGAVGFLGSILPSLTALKAETSLEYWGNSSDFLGGSSNLSVVSANGTAKYFFTSSGISPFAGAGIGLVFSRASIKYKEQIFGLKDYSDSETDIDLNLVGGVDIPVGVGMKFTAEGKIAVGDADWFQITGGILVMLK
ncbi:TPA: hypothetical protein ENX78_14590 [Candidatus Poribacteria bacterium]|nr:hypothetical protein [Candidatus Poribacteria bacterium]